MDRSLAWTAVLYGCLAVLAIILLVVGEEALDALGMLLGTGLLAACLGLGAYGAIWLWRNRGE